MRVEAISEHAEQKQAKFEGEEAVFPWVMSQTQILESGVNHAGSC
jgi:hypothetical protein